MKKFILNTILTLISVSAFASEAPMSDLLKNIDPTSKEQGQKIKHALNNDIQSSEFECKQNKVELDYYKILQLKMEMSEFLEDPRSNLVVNNDSPTPLLSVEFQQDETVATTFFDISTDLKHVNEFELLIENIIPVEVNEGTLLKSNLRAINERKTKVKIKCGRF